MIHLQGVLTPEDIRHLREAAQHAPWVDGSVTAAGAAAQQKRNQQVDETSIAGAAIAKRVMDALGRHPLFAAAAFPARITQPLMNRYAPGMEYGAHYDTPLMGGAQPLRTDISGTLFLSDPADYDGGELVVETLQGRQAAKLPAGDMALYPSTQLHFVSPVTRGTRVAVVIWVQSMIRDTERRALLFELSQALSALKTTEASAPEIMRIAGCHHRLVQMWAET
jgi:PKHD-type hydroxylase